MTQAMTRIFIDTDTSSNAIRKILYSEIQADMRYLFQADPIS